LLFRTQLHFLADPAMIETSSAHGSPTAPENWPFVKRSVGKPH
jgi:hypothetical protein